MYYKCHLDIPLFNSEKLQYFSDLLTLINLNDNTSIYI